MDQVEENKNKFFISTTPQNVQQRQLNDLLRRKFDSRSNSDDLVGQLGAGILFTSREVPENYEIYRVIGAELGNKGIEVPESHVTGLLMSRRLVRLLWDREKNEEAE